MDNETPASPTILVDDLRNLRAMNRFLGGCRVLLHGLKSFLRQEKMTHFSVLDVGTGSGDIPAAVARWSRKQGFETRIVALDSHKIMTAVAAEYTRNFPEISIVRCDAGAPPFRRSSFDIVVASQFLHHFTEADIIALLRRWADVGRRAIVISDLVRHPAAYYGIDMLTRLSTRNPMTINDAPLSVRRALTIPEWRNLFIQASVGRVEICSVAPFRMYAVISLSPG